jgi:hypothetical protein
MRKKTQMESTNQRVTSFWDKISPERLDAYLGDGIAAHDIAEAARVRVAPPPIPRAKRTRPTVQAHQAVEPAAVAAPQSIPNTEQIHPMTLYRRVKRTVVKSSLLILTGVALAVFVPRWLSLNVSNGSVVIRVAGYEVATDPKPSKTDQEPVTLKSDKTDQDAATPKSNKTERETVTSSELSKAAPEAVTSPRLRRSIPEDVTNPEPTKPAPEAVTRSEPAAVDTSEPIFDRNRELTGTYLEWAAAGDPGTLYKGGREQIDCRSDRFIGDRAVIAKMVREVKASIVKGTVMWAEQQPDGAIDVHTYANVREDIYGDQTAFKLHSPLVQCRQGISRIASDGVIRPADELKLPREMWYRTGSSLAQH